MQAREVLFADKELRMLNLGITVRNHQAMLWGPVPSREISLRAEIRLRTMLPFADVRNEFIVLEEPIIQDGTPLPELPPYLPDITPVDLQLSLNSEEWIPSNP